MAHSDPTDTAWYDQELAGVTVGGARPLAAQIEIHDYDAGWPELYRREEGRIRAVLGDRVVRIEHAGSTAVPALPAKPIVDIALEVQASPSVRGHRLLEGPDANVNLHVFSAGCEEVGRMLLFRDRLRSDRADREFYAAAKRKLAARDWTYGQQYADAKTAIVLEILARAEPSTRSDSLGGQA